jgi:PEP-CTERM motif-containing protein
LRRAIQTTVVSCLLLVGRQAYADPVVVGDVLHILGSDGNIWGGAFDVDNTSNGPGVDFQTFCLQLNEDVDYDNLFVVGSITDSADDDGGPDPISLETAWIFSSFRHGALSAFTSDEIQTAIWMLEGDWLLTDALFVFGPSIIGDPEALIALAETNVNAGWVNDGVRVINLFTLDGEKAQDQLTLSEVPEPGTLLLVAGGVAALMKRRRTRRPHHS